jgi:metallo-beta-lactamase family protein
MNDISLQFLGAAGTVTGSKHLLKTPEGNILVDCGLFQGLKSLRLKNREPLHADLREIKAVLLTHAHLDHCGYLPLLVKNGFAGKIYCSEPTRELTAIILRDSARIQEEDSELENRGGYSKHQPALPLYTEKDVEKMLPMLEVVREGEELTISHNIKAVFKHNAHILGSTYIKVSCFGKSILFSGDLGRPSSALLPAPSPIEDADFIVMESTYGDRLHPQVAPGDELAHAIVDTLLRKGNVVIPSFAVGRAQELMHIINMLKSDNRIPNVPVFMDSPMGAIATDVLRAHPSWHKLSREQCDAIFENIGIITKFEDSLKVIAMKASKIIIAASGMLTGGRVLFYLEKYLQDDSNMILFTGYQSEGTRGRALLEGGHEIKIHGKYYTARAQVRSIGSMSGHADQQEMLSWLSTVSRAPEKIFLVHGENIPREAFRVKIETDLGWTVVVPGQDQEEKLFAVPVQ